MPIACFPLMVVLKLAIPDSERPVVRRAEAGSMSFYCCGVRIDTPTQELAAERILAAALERVPLAVHLCNAYTLSLALDDRAFGARLNADDLNLPDGMPLVWIARRLGMRWLTKRVYGPDLMAEVLDRGRCLGLRHYMYGSTPEVLEALQRELESRYPGLDIAGAEAPPFRALTNAEVRCNIERMHTSGADVVWAGLGTPKQDEFVHSFHEQIGCPTVAVGAAFDFFAGATKQAPRWMQSIGLEWLFRLSHEPRRLWRRYLIGNTKFLKGLVVEGTSLSGDGGDLERTERPRASVTALLASFKGRKAVLRSLRSLIYPSEDAEVAAIVVDAKRSDNTSNHEPVARRHARRRFGGSVMDRSDEGGL
jgi:N-acetylglucosaminyldiphosphoundecaprenol N-acetyl-beta-D-mannosaminyltransferase